MIGPHPPNPAIGTDGPLPYPEDADRDPRNHEYPPDFRVTGPGFGTGQRPPPATYPRRRPKRLLIGILLAIALAGALSAAVVYGVRTNGSNSGSAFSDRSAKTAIQGYLDALEHRDVDTIVRNALCGIYDGVKDKRSDLALAKLNSDAFRSQYSRAEVTSIDKIVYWSQYQAQVLFSMQTAPATDRPPRGQRQGIAQLLYQRNQILVCSYVVRTPGSP